MSGWTNRGKYNALAGLYRGATLPTNYFAALVTDTPTADTNLMSDLTEIQVGNGYTQGGISLTPNATDFDSLVENDTDDRAELQIKDLVWTASGGPIPSSGSGALYMVITNDIATAASGSREVLNYFSLGSARSVSDGQALTIQNAEMRLTE